MNTAITAPATLVCVLGLLGLSCASVDPEHGEPAETPVDSGGPPPDASALELRPEGPLVEYSEAREPCADRNPVRNAYFGDLHVHTAYSFDAYNFDTRADPVDAYRFAQGSPIALPPLDDAGEGTRIVQLERPLDFAAATDHAELLGEVELCTIEGSPSYDTLSCRAYRTGINGSGIILGAQLAAPDPSRSASICGRSGEICATAADAVWTRTREAAEAAYDRTSACSFTSFVGYEWTRSPGGQTLHRNVIFRNDQVPALPISAFEEPTPQGLWARLKTECLDVEGCDVLAIPHNPNLSNGQTFAVEYPGAATIGEEREQAAFRARMEPLVEMVQHKGTSECSPAFNSDEECAFEVLEQSRCGDDTTSEACTSPLSFVRSVLLAGLAEQVRLGDNPYRIGFIGSTDTHNGTPGNVEEASFAGHGGSIDATPRVRLLTAPQDASQLNPGGLAGVWAVENSRDAIFDAFVRRETFATSGPRIRVRLFGGWSYPEDLCRDPNMLESAYAEGVPMGGELPAPAGASAPRFVLSAMRDRIDLQYAQIIKGWLDADGDWHEQVYDVAGDRGNGARVNTETCEPRGSGAAVLCSVWTDPDFHRDQHAFYYARVLENPTCRWSTRDCNSLGRRAPESCTDGSMPRTVQERAWSSPIWYRPG